MQTLEKDVFVYLDNVTIAGRDQTEHDRNVKAFLDAIHRRKFTRSDSKTVTSHSFRSCQSRSKQSTHFRLSKLVKRLAADFLGTMQQMLNREKESTRLEKEEQQNVKIYQYLPCFCFDRLLHNGQTFHMHSK